MSMEYLLLPVYLTRYEYQQPINTIHFPQSARLRLKISFYYRKEDWKFAGFENFQDQISFRF